VQELGTVVAPTMLWTTG
nr:immunoglobulin heavy chain junction region [Mus musculus]